MIRAYEMNLKKIYPTQRWVRGGSKVLSHLLWSLQEEELGYEHKSSQIHDLGTLLCTSDHTHPLKTPPNVFLYKRPTRQKNKA